MTHNVCVRRHVGKNKLEIMSTFIVSFADLFKMWSSIAKRQQYVWLRTGNLQQALIIL
jgi:hypothetical protein